MHRRSGLRNTLKIVAPMLGCAVFLTLGAPNASADYAFDLGLGNSAISGYPGPYANVDVHLVDSNDASITFTALDTGGFNYLFGAQGAVGVNVNAASWTLGPITGSNSGTGFLSPVYSNGGSNTEDGFGVFNQTIDAFDGYQHSADQVTFTLHNVGGTWSSDTDVLTGNASGYLAAAHIFVTGSENFSDVPALATGYATNGASAVPEPNSVMMLGALLLGGVTFARRRRQSQN